MCWLLFFPILLPFYILRVVFRLVFGLMMLPFMLLGLMLFVAGAILFAMFTAATVLLTPLVPFVLIGLAVWALTRRSRAASAYPN